MKTLFFPRQVLIFIFITFVSPAYSFASDTYHVDNLIKNHQENPRITAVVPSFFPPYYYVDNEGTPYGMGIEVLNEIDHSAGYLTHFLVKENWAEVFKSINSGEAQVIPNLGITEERKKHYYFSKPYSKTKVTVFSKKGNTLKQESDLAGIALGVVNKNIGKKIAENRGYKNIHVYESIELAFKALVNNEVGAIIFPRLIARTAATQLNIGHQVYDTGITLKTIHRALAVSKKHPEIFFRLNDSLKAYLNSQDYHDTYTAWYGSTKKDLTNTQIIFLNLLVLIVSIYIFKYFWNKKQFSIFKTGNNSKWVVTLISIFVISTTTVTLLTTWLLYNTSFEEQRHRLIDSVKSRARLIEAVARYDEKDSKFHNRSTSASHEKTLSQVIDAHKYFHGFGKTGEFTFARRNKDKIEFVLQQRHTYAEKPEAIPFSSEFAIPMQLALHGHSGTIVGKDYRGVNVLAAYEKVAVLNMGIVAKIDIKEIREPFIHSALYISTIVIIISFLGSLFFFYIIIPVIKKMQESEQRFHQLFLNNYTPALLVNAKNARIIDANTAALNFYHYSHDELCSNMLITLCANQDSPVLKVLQHVKARKQISYTTQHRLQTGEYKDVEILMSPVEIENESVIYCTIIDITDKLKQQKEHDRMQQDLVQARKMEALGQLTGGIAHDFNNMLGIIMGYTELSREKVGNDVNNKIPGYLDHVMTASNHAKEMISSMMLFSRTDEGTNIALNISPLVKEDIKLLRSIIPTSIKIISDIDESVPNILIEPVKLQQLIMNLCINARDAMDAQGVLTIRLTYRINMDDNCLICYEHFEGDWVELTISDTGSGMSEEVKKHIFEPFYTTKDQHKGTGMGMAVVHGIVQDLGGHILIDSERGKGSSIHILFKPLSKEEIVSEEKEIQLEKEQRHEKILIVDDEETLTEMVADILELYGYQCSCFSSSQQALNQFTKTPDQFDLIFSDQTMPDLTGLEMIKEMRKIRPDIPAIIATGYSDSIDDSIAQKSNIKLLRKPLPKDKLVKTVNDIFQNKRQVTKTR